ncbi:MAG TPA: hypothetical protein VFI30_08175 [Nocardioidaceae bacterium]|nr:hypothetical protein [Nocardioidaceae bacterium]
MTAIVTEHEVGGPGGDGEVSADAMTTATSDRDLQDLSSSVCLLRNGTSVTIVTPSGNVDPTG